MAPTLSHGQERCLGQTCSLERCQGKPEKPGPAGLVTGEGVRNRLGSNNKVQAMSLQRIELKMQTEAELKAQANNRDLSVIIGLSHNKKYPKQRLWSPAAIKVILCIKPDTGLAQREKQNKRELQTSCRLTDTNDLEDYQNFLARALNKCKK